MRERLEAATPPAAPLPERPSNRDRLSRTVYEQVNLEIQTRAPPIRDIWTKLTEARVAAGDGRADDVRTTLAEMGGVPSHALVEIGSALAAKASGARNTFDRARLEQALPLARFGLPQRSGRRLFGLLLDAETPARAAASVNPWDRMFMGRETAARGGCEENAPAGDIVTLCFQSIDATPTVTEERALLRVALMAIERRKSHFVFDAQALKTFLDPHVKRREVQRQCMSARPPLPLPGLSKHSGDGVVGAPQSSIR